MALKSDEETDWAAFADQIEERRERYRPNDGKAGSYAVDPKPEWVHEVYRALFELTSEQSPTTKAKYISEVTEVGSTRIGMVLRILEDMGAVERVSTSRPYQWAFTKRR